MSREIEMEWPELGIKVVATLAEDKNPGLCKVLWDNLPIVTMQSHCAVSGDSMYACHNIVSFVEPEYVETYEDKKEYWGHMPEKLIGVVTFGTLGGIWGFGVRWGKEFTEPVPSAPVAYVKEEDLGKLREAGEKVRNGMLFFNKYYRLMVRRRE